MGFNLFSCNESIQEMWLRQLYPATGAVKRQVLAERKRINP